MPDPTTDEHTRALFTELRAEELPRVLPPGAAQAHRTVRRRKVATAAVATATAVLVLAGGGAVYARLTAPLASTVPAPADAPTATVQDAPYLLADQARRAVQPTDALEAAIVGSGPLSSMVQDVDEGLDGRGVADGRYRLSYACRGAGTARLTWSIGTRTWVATMACGLPGPTAPLEADGALDGQGGGVMTVRIEPDGEALGRAAYAYVVTKT